MTKETESVREQVSIKYIDALNDRDRAISLIEDLLRQSYKNGNVG